MNHFLSVVAAILHEKSGNGFDWVDYVYQMFDHKNKKNQKNVLK